MGWVAAGGAAAVLDRGLFATLRCLALRLALVEHMQPATKVVVGQPRVWPLTGSRFRMEQ